MSGFSKPRGESSWYPRRPRAFFNGCLGMTFDERAAYSTLLDLIYEHGGPIYYDLGHIASHMGTGFPTRKAAALVRRLEELGKIYRLPDERIGNVEADRALAQAEEKRAKAVEFGAKGGRPARPKSELSPEQVDNKSEGSREEPAGNRVTSFEESPPDINKDNDLLKGLPLGDENPIRKEKKRKESKRDREDRIIEENFPPFWDAYPPRAGSDSRKEALKRYTAAIRAGHDPADIYAGVLRYRKERQGEDPKFVKMASSWLNQELWISKGRPSAPPAVQAGPPAAPVDPAKERAAWQWRLAAVARGEHWKAYEWGPAPWQEGTLVPADMNRYLGRGRGPGGVRVLASEFD